MQPLDVEYAQQTVRKQKRFRLTSTDIELSLGNILNEIAGSKFYFFNNLGD